MRNGRHTIQIQIYSFFFLSANTFYSIFVLFTCSTLSFMVANEGFGLFMMNFFSAVFQVFFPFFLVSHSTPNTSELCEWRKNDSSHQINPNKCIQLQMFFDLPSGKGKPEAIIYQNSIFSGGRSITFGYWQMPIVITSESKEILNVKMIR